MLVVFYEAFLLSKGKYKEVGRVKFDYLSVKKNIIFISFVDYAKSFKWYFENN